MSLESEIFAKKRLLVDNLVPFGFVQTEQGFAYRECVMEGDFEVQVAISPDGELSSRVMDTDLNEEYLTLYAERVTGSFVGQVREAYQAVLEKIADACFEALPFAKDQTNRLANRIASTWDDALDHPFEKYPQYASYRIGGKWYALIFPLKREKLGFSGAMAEQEVEVVNLKVEPAEMDKLLSKDGIFPSYHMSKKTWISVVLDDSLTDDEVWDLIAKSRSLVTPQPAS